MEEQSAYHDFPTIGNPLVNDSLSDLGPEVREVRIVTRDDPHIDRFLTDIPKLSTLHATCGLIWDERLRPCKGSYEPDIHYFATGQQSKKSAHGVIEFYRDGTSGAVFAVKVLHDKDSFNCEEIYSRLQLQHKNIADVYGIMVRSGIIHILMEHAGTPLVKERSWFSESSERMCQLASQSFRALCFLHVKGYVHCDVKPDNLMVVRKDDSFTLKVIDFGTCRRIKQPLPPNAHTTWQYWPPEMWKAWENKETFIAEASMDVYAMALTLYFVKMGSHLMHNMPQEVMCKKPEYVKMMAIPESIPVDVRSIMNHCLEVNTVSRYTAEEAARRLEEPCSSSKEEYFANLNSVARCDGRKKSFVDNWLEKSGAKTNTTHCVVGSNKSISQREIMVGPDAAMFKGKTSLIFQKLESISNSNAKIIDKREIRARPAGEFRHENHNEEPGPSGVQKCGETNQKNDLQGKFPFLFLLEKIANEHNKNPILFSKQQDMSDDSPVPKQAKVAASVSTHEAIQMTSKVGKTKTPCSVSRQKNRAKMRQKNYDRNLCTIKSSSRKAAPSSSSSSDKTFGKVEKLWPSSATGETSFKNSSYNKPPNNTNVDDMEFVIDAFAPDAFKPENENNITDYMFDMLQRQESEEGSESIRVDMDGMSLSSPDVTERGRLTMGNDRMEEMSKDMPSKPSSVALGLPNFEMFT